MNKRDYYLNVYTPTWQRAVRSLAREGYWTKGLDDGDRGFLRSYCGRADDYENDNELWATPSSGLLDDDAQYDDDLNVTRAQKRTYRGGKSIQEQHEQAERQRVYYARLQAKRRAVVEKRQEQIDALRKAYIESADEREKRMLKTMLADIAWEKQNDVVPEPEPTPRRKVTLPLIAGHTKSKSGRHYIPQWRLDEIEAEVIKRAKADVEREEARIAEMRKAQEEMLKAQDERIRASKEERLAKQRLVQRQREEFLADHQSKMQAIREQHPTLHAQECERIKYAVLTSIRGTGRMWTVEELMQAARCNDRNLLMKCCNELVGGGYLHPTMGSL